MPATSADRIRGNLALIEQRIADALQGRARSAVRLMAVTKAQGPAVLASLADEGIDDWGENRVDHLQEMAADPAAERGRFHYIGRVQSRQFARFLPQVASLHSLCEPSHIAKLDRVCAEQERDRFPVFLQVNTADEDQKAGLLPDDLPSVLDQVHASAHLEAVGLMCMAPDRDLPDVDDDRIRRCFVGLRELAERHGLDRLSMGMSKDYPIAVEEGATDLRLGTCLFADRTP